MCGCSRNANTVVAGNMYGCSVNTQTARGVLELWLGVMEICVVIRELWLGVLEICVGVLETKTL